jgi:hypothetical protein
MPNDQNEPAKKGPPIEDASMLHLRWASEELKAKIAEAKARCEEAATRLIRVLHRMLTVKPGSEFLRDMSERHETLPWPPHTE